MIPKRMRLSIFGRGIVIDWDLEPPTLGLFPPGSFPPPPAPPPTLSPSSSINSAHMTGHDLRGEGQHNATFRQHGESVTEHQQQQVYI